VFLSAEDEMRNGARVDPFRFRRAVLAFAADARPRPARTDGAVETTAAGTRKAAGVKD
jgi:hypothetical protein